MVPRLTETTSTGFNRDQIVEVLCMCELFGCNYLRNLSLDYNFISIKCMLSVS